MQNILDTYARARKAAHAFVLSGVAAAAQFHFVIPDGTASLVTSIVALALLAPTVYQTVNDAI